MHRLAPERSQVAERGQAESVAARRRFEGNDVQVSVDRGDRVGAPAKAFELRVLPVPFRLSTKNSPRQQALAPQRD